MQDARQLTALSLECVDNVERCDGLALGVLSVCDCVADNALEEGLENTACLFVDHCERKDVSETCHGAVMDAKA